MAGLYDKHAEEYSYARPTYPEEIFQFISSKTKSQDLAWDAGTGSGQAARSLAGIFKNVVATDISLKQLEFAAKLPNIRYYCTPPRMSMAELEKIVAAESSVDLVAIATALHWFDLPSFYEQVKRVLKKPNGVISAWTYTKAGIKTSATLNSLLQKLFFDCDPFCEPQLRFALNDKYKTIDFPFQPVDGLDHTGPFEFTLEKSMDLDGFFNFVTTLSSYQTAKRKGVEILTEDVVQDYVRAWNEDGKPEKVVTFPIHLRIGRVVS